MFSGESRRHEVTEQMWYDAEDCSRSVQWRLEKLGRRRLKGWYEEQRVNDTKWNADAFETLTLLDGEVRQRGMTVPGHEDICKPERPAWNLSSMELSASVIGVERRDVITLWWHEDARVAAFITDCKCHARCLPTLHCSSPAAVASDTKPVAGRQS